MSKVPKVKYSLPHPIFSLVIVVFKMKICRNCESPILAEKAPHGQVPANPSLVSDCFSKKLTL
jgi:hypothetical protein